MKKFHVIALVLLLAGDLILIQSSALTRARTAPAATRLKPKAQADQNQPHARVSDRITLHAAGRGGPWINLKDGHDLITAYTGTSGLESAMQLNQARPLALASGDFDEDGVPDLIGGYGCADGSPSTGVFTLHRGNVDAIYPDTAEAEQRKAAGEFTEAPFLSPGVVFGAAVEPDFIGTGDFDADGHLDVVMASQRSDRLYWLSGDGQGSFGAGQTIALPGIVTALVTGEMNRADGLADVIVGITESTQAKRAGGAQPSRVLIFEGPEGAFKHDPETISLPAQATSLALGQLDENYEMDLAVAAGSALVVVHGRDRKLSLDAERRAEVAPVGMEQTLPFAINSMVLGDFTGDYRAELALLSPDGVVHVLEPEAKSGEWKKIISEVATGTRSLWSRTETQTEVYTTPLLVRARVSVSGKDDLLVVDRADRQVQVIANNAALKVKGGQSLDSTSPSLRVAASLDMDGEPIAVLPLRLNTDALSDLVVLKQGGSGALAVVITAPVATFTVNQTSNEGDANTNDGICDTDLATAGLQCTLRAAIGQANVSAGADTITFSVSSITPVGIPAIVGPLTIDGGTSRVEIKGSLQLGSSNCTIRGLVINNGGISLAQSNATGNSFFEGNFLGTDVTGSTAAVSNSPYTGVSISGSTGNTIGGTTAAARNVISGNSLGVAISNAAPGNKVQGNYIGVNAAGLQALGNTVNINIESNNNSPNQMIGGTAAGAGNVVSGSRNWAISGRGTGHLVQGNLIGTNALGNAAVPNNTAGAAEAIDIGQIGSTTIGGTTPAARNIISGNKAGAILLSGPSNLVQGNYIGTDISGTQALGNGPNNSAGVTISSDSGATASGNSVGGTAAGAGNIIAYSFYGVRYITVGPNNGIRRNSIFGHASQAIFFTEFERPALTTSNGTVQGTLSGLGITPNTSYTIEFFSNPVCDTVGFEGGKTFLSDVTVTTNGSGIATFTGPTAQNVTATATLAGGNTSRFSNCTTGATPTPSPSPSPQIHLFPAQLNFTANEGGANPPTQTVTLTNTGGSPLNWTAETNKPWIGVTSSSGTSGTLAPNQSTTLTVSVTVGTLTGGNFGKLTISSPNATNNPQEVNVLFDLLKVDKIEIVQGTVRVNGATLDQVLLGSPSVVFSCDVQYQLASGSARGEIYLAAVDRSSRFADFAQKVKDQSDVAEKSGDPKIQHVTFPFTIPQRSLQKNIPKFDIGLALLDNSRAERAFTHVEFQPRDWLYIAQATANGTQVYGQSMETPVPDRNGKINLILTLGYRQTSGPGFAYVNVTGESGTSFTPVELEVPLAETASNIIDIPLTIDVSHYPTSSALQVQVFQRNSQHQRIEQRFPRFSFYLNFTPDADARFQGTRSTNSIDPTPHDALNFASNHSPNPNQGAACLAPPSNIVSWFPGEVNGNDIQGGSNATLQNGATFSAGKVGQAFSFDGVDDRALTPTINLGNQFTVELWVRPTTNFNAYQHLVSNGYTSSNYGALYYDRNTFTYWQGGVVRVVTPTLSALNTWSHVALTYDGSVDRLYHNGALISTSSVHTENFSTPVMFGYAILGESAHFPGLLDEISLYNRALSGAEIQSIFNADSAGKCAPTPTPSPSPSPSPSPFPSPGLIDLLAPGSSTANSFVTDTVDGASTTVLKFPSNNGLALSPTTNVVSNNVYSIVMLLKFDEANKRRRILDFKNGTSDNGLYAGADNNLGFSPMASGVGGPITANQYLQVAITRDTSGVVTGYVNGAQQFQFTDTNNDAVIDSNNTLRFFQDNLTGGTTGEASAGSFARLRLYARALDAREIAGLDREPSSVKFSAATFSVSEGAGFATITVTRAGSTSVPATVDFFTSDETASQRLDYTIASGTLSFAAGETTKTFRVLVTDNLSVDLDRIVVLFLTSPRNVALDSQSVATLNITDNDTTPSTTNPLEDADALFFVRQHYYDFLSRTPDPGGLAFWAHEITQCGSDPICIRNKRIDVSNAFYYELEYQQTGSYVYRLYRAAYGNTQPLPNPDSNPAFPGEAKKVPSYQAFAPDRARVRGGASLAQTQLDLANTFAQRPEFIAKYPPNLAGPAFVDAVLATIRNDIGPDLSSQRQALLDLFNSGGRGAVLYRLADDNIQTNPINNRGFIDAEYNRAFVVTQYFGYLRRNPDIGGLLFWLGQVNAAPLRDVNRQHAMVCSFITSGEYQQRFSPIVPRSNAECPQ